MTCIQQPDRHASGHSLMAQLNMFGNQLSRLPEFSNLANGNESYDSLAAKIKEMLRDPIQQKHFLPPLKNLGFKA
ncbi:MULTISPECIES: hypothetical protein [Acinetobacter]|nr:MULTISPECIES: hypothetical protein [Acinetobacter]EJB8376760.1 hypothetical protein [Acinetobacter baumannii]MBI1411475.1 hypothetical protein [Acinetobacter baumannii]MBI1432829.1 hypothetical protein [Acinetobacter baumannii]MBJ8465837.1 hypothetical protein [Acinetobacter nosocomialis]MBM0877458.1 hypothetical protein [Acinetobacter pittii]